MVSHSVCVGTDFTRIVNTVSTLVMLFGTDFRLAPPFRYMVNARTELVAVLFPLRFEPHASTLQPVSGGKSTPGDHKNPGMRGSGNIGELHYVF